MTRSRADAGPARSAKATAVAAGRSANRMWSLVKSSPPSLEEPAYFVWPGGVFVWPGGVFVWPGDVFVWPGDVFVLDGGVLVWPLAEPLPFPPALECAGGPV